MILVYLDKNTDELHAKTFLEEYNSTAEVVWNAYTEASWKYNTDITEANKQAMVRHLTASLKMTSSCFYCVTASSSDFYFYHPPPLWVLVHKSHEIQ